MKKIPVCRFLMRFLAAPEIFPAGDVSAQQACAGADPEILVRGVKT